MAYGYEGDLTPDPNSAEGIGAFSFDDTPGSLVPMQDAALKKEDAENIYHVRPGEFFTDPATGQTHRYADVIPSWSPVRPGYVDVYDPQHPPDIGSRYSVAPAEPRSDDEYFSYLPTYGDDSYGSQAEQQQPPKEETPKEQVSPLDQVRRSYPEFSKLSDDQLTAKMTSIFPDVPSDKLAVYVKQPNGMQLIKDEITKDLTPLEKFKKIYPEKAAKLGDDDKIISWMHDNLDPFTAMDAFKDKVNPPPPVINGIKQALGQIGEGLGGEAFKQGALAGAQQTYGKWEQMPKAGTDVLDGLYKAAGVYGWEKIASAWLQKNVPGYGAANDYFVKFVNDLNNRGKEFEKQADQAQATIPKTAEGQVAGTIGEIAGSIPDIAVSFGLGGTGKAAALWGMAYEGTSAYGRAIENQQKNALQQGVTEAGFRGFAQYLMNTGQGRIVTGIENSIASATEEEVQKWLRGEPNDITKDAKTVTVGFLMGLLMGGKRPKAEYKAPAENVEPGIAPTERTVTAAEVLGPEVADQTPWYQQPSPIVTRAREPETFSPAGLAKGVAGMRARGTPEEMRQAAEKLRPATDFRKREVYFSPEQLKGEAVINPSGRPEEPTQEHHLTFTFDHHTPPVAEELNKAQAAHQNGDTDRAAAHIDKAIAVMPKEQVDTLATQAVDKVHELADSSADVAKIAEEKSKGEAGGRAAAARKRGAIVDVLKKIRDDRNYQPTPKEHALLREWNKREDKDDLFYSASANTEDNRLTEHPKMQAALDRILSSEAKTAPHYSSPEAAISATSQSLKEVQNRIREQHQARLDDLDARHTRGEIDDENYRRTNQHWKRQMQTALLNGKIEWEQKEYRSKHPLQPDTEFNDYYFAGIPFSPKAIRDSFKAIYEGTGMEKTGRKLREVWRPEVGSELKETFGQIVKSEEARSKQAQARIPSDIARAHGILDVVKNGDRSEVRERFFQKFTEADRIQQFLDYQEGNPLKDRTANSIWERVYRPIYEMLAKREAYYGIEHEVRQNYFQQLFEHPLDEQTRLREDVRKQVGGPAYTKEREMTYREHIERGDKPVTTNPERLMQMRWRASELAIQKIRDMMQLEEQGGAYETNRPDIPPRVKNQRWGIQSTANGRNFYVNPDVNAILNNKFRSADVYRGAAAPYFKFMSALKGTTAGLLSWSAFHPLHILDILTSDMSATAYMLRKAGKKSWETALDEALNLVPGVGGLVQGTRMSIKYKDLVNALKGLVDKKDITADMDRDMRDIRDMGISVQVNRERMMQFSEGLRNLLPRWIREAPDGHLISMGAKALGMVYKAGTNSPFTKWWFGDVQPRLKVASALMRRDALLATRPDLLKASKRGELLREYGKIQRDVEARFGELDYDNLLWPKWIKQVGTTHLLSLGWQLGMVRTMGDGVIDMTTNAAHMDEIWARSKNLNEFERNMVTNRMAFQAAYMGRGALTGLAIAYLVGRVTPTLWDAFYPRVGKDSNGKDKRVNMQYFTKDIPALNEYSKQEGSWLGGILRMGLNKINPVAMTAWQAMSNKDYMGRPIGELPARIAYFLRNSFEPISLQNITRVGPKDATDIIMDILGYSPSARWTQRSALENEIIQKSFEKPGQEMSDARDEYRQAYLTHDRAGMMEARKKLKELKATDRQIQNIEKEAHLSSAQKAWKHLSNAKKAEMLQKMSPEDRKEWLKLSPHAGPVP